MRGILAGHWKLMKNWEQSSKPILLQLCEKLPKNSFSTALRSFNLWSKLERWKCLKSGCFKSRLKIKKIVVLKCHILFYATATNCFLIGWWYAAKSQFYTTGDDQLSGWTENKLQSTSQSQTCTEKSHGHSLVMCCSSDPQQISESSQKPLYLRGMLGKSMRFSENCDVCSWYWPTEWV